MKIIDIVNSKFGKLTVLEKAFQNKEKRWFYKCSCDCGNIVYRPKNRLSKNRNSSCGCGMGEHKITHGMRKTKEYSTWTGIKDRCNNLNGKDYKNYMGRGISICDSWNKSFESFYSDMGKAPTKKHQIDRIDNNGQYNKENCKWSTPKEQSLNKRNSKIWFIRGVYFESAQDAADFWCVSDITIHRWCKGKNRVKKKKDCHTMMRYAK